MIALRTTGLFKARWLVWVLVPAVIWFLARDISASEWHEMIGMISFPGLVLLLALNALVALVFSSRWWLALRAYGFKLPYLTVFRYRIAAFSISYFTPGTQFGGEPLQIFALEKHHRIPRSAALASVAVDKLFEIVANFSFLAIGLSFALQYSLPQGLKSASTSTVTFLGAVSMVFFTLGYLIALKTSHRPLTALLAGIPARVRALRWMARLEAFTADTENHLVDLVGRRPKAAFLLVLASFAIWAGSLAEYGLALRIMGAPLNFQQTITALLAARIAFLTPLPAGVGALEAGQMLAMQALGLNPALGIAISLWIRVRDLALGGLGFLWGAAIIQTESSFRLSAETGD